MSRFVGALTAAADAHEHGLDVEIGFYELVEIFGREV
jgi:hypothetical protein